MTIPTRFSREIVSGFHVSSLELLGFEITVRDTIEPPVEPEPPPPVEPPVEPPVDPEPPPIEPPPVVTNGWTVFTPSVDTLKVYVSATGSDTNDGLTEATAKATIQAGMALLRDGFPDWLLLEKGGTWTTNIGWTKSGRSDVEQMLLGTYGTGSRPKIDSTSGNGIHTSGSGLISHVVFVGLEVTSSVYNGSAAQNSWHSLKLENRSSGVNDILCEDLYMHNYSTVVLLQQRGNQPPLPYPNTNVRFRRCVFGRAYNTANGISQSLYGNGVDGLTVEECVFHKGGFDPDNPGSLANVFSHTLYMNHETRNIIFRKNTCVISASNIMFRGSSLVFEDNYLNQTPTGLVWGGGVDAARTPDSGAQGIVQHNVFQDAPDIGSKPKGRAFTVDNLMSGLLKGNIMSLTNPADHDAHPMNIGSGTLNTVGVNNLTVENNIVYQWRGKVRTGGAIMSNVVFKNNDVQNTLGRSFPPWIMELKPQFVGAWTSSGNRFFNTAEPDSQDFTQGTLADYKAAVGDTTSVDMQVAYTDPDRTPALYMDHVEGLAPGTSTLQDYVDKLLAQSKDNWDPRYMTIALNAWIREGFQEA